MAELTLETRVSNLETKIDMFIGEVREQNKMRAAEIRALDDKLLKMQENTDAKLVKMQKYMDARLEKIQEKTDARFEKMEEKIDGMTKHVRNLTITAMVGIGAISIAVIGFVFTVVTK